MTVDLRSAATELRLGALRFSRRLRWERANTDLGDAAYAALGSLLNAGPLSIGALAHHNRVSAPSMNRTINCLVDDGYVERTPDPEDGRRVTVILTDTGAELVAATRLQRDSWLAEQLATLSPEDREVLHRAAILLNEVAAR